MVEGACSRQHEALARWPNELRRTGTGHFLQATRKGAIETGNARTNRISSVQRAASRFLGPVVVGSVCSSGIPGKWQRLDAHLWNRVAGQSIVGGHMRT